MDFYQEAIALTERDRVQAGWNFTPPSLSPSPAWLVGSLGVHTCAHSQSALASWQDLLHPTTWRRPGLVYVQSHKVPLVGPSIDRHTLNLLTLDYNDRCVRALVCFVCGQKHVATPGSNSAIEYCDASWFAARGRDTLHANVGWERWAQLHGSQAPMTAEYGPGSERAGGRGQWCCEISFRRSKNHMRLFGCPEDWRCNAPPDSEPLRRRHPELHEGARVAALSALRGDAIVTLCTHCELPACKSCRVQLVEAHGSSI